MSTPENNQDKVPELVSMLWTLSNLITGFSAAQGIAFGYATLQEPWQKKVDIPHFPIIISVFIIAGVALEAFAVWWCHNKSLVEWAPPQYQKDLFRKVACGRIVCILLFGLACLLAAWGPRIDKTLKTTKGRPTTLNTTGSLTVDLRGSIQDFTGAEAVHCDQLVVRLE